MSTAVKPNEIKIRSEQGETRIYLDGVHVGRIRSWCPPASERNKGAKRLGSVSMLDGRLFNFDGYYRDQIIKWVRSGEWITSEAPVPSDPDSIPETQS